MQRNPQLCDFSLRSFLKAQCIASIYHPVVPSSLHPSFLFSFHSSIISTSHPSSLSFSHPSRDIHPIPYSFLALLSFLSIDSLTLYTRLPNHPSSYTVRISLSRQEIPGPEKWRCLLFTTDTRVLGRPTINYKLWYAWKVNACRLGPASVFWTTSTSSKDKLPSLQNFIKKKKIKKKKNQE